MDNFINNYIQILGSITTLVSIFSINKNMFSKSTISHGLIICFIVILVIMSYNFTISILFYITIVTLIFVFIIKKFYFTKEKNEDNNINIEKVYGKKIFYVISRIVYIIITLSCLASYVSYFNIYETDSYSKSKSFEYLQGLLYLLKTNEMNEVKFILSVFIFVFGLIALFLGLASCILIFIPYKFVLEEKKEESGFVYSSVCIIFFLFSTYILLGPQFINFHFKIIINIIQKTFFLY